jgi:hypothetical protein
MQCIGGDVKHHVALLDGPIHPRSLQPDIEGLLRWEDIAKAMPRGLAYVGHVADQVSHGRSPMKKGLQRQPQSVFMQMIYN